MKLNNEKNIMLCQKALYSKQLQYYSKLCKLYSELAKLKGPDITPDEVQDTYSEALALAAKGNLDFLKPENNLVYSNNYTTQKYSNEEIEIFKKYAFHSGRLAQFKEASSILKGSIIRFSFQDPEFDLTAINKYKDYMQNTSKSTKLFDKFISESSPRLIGHNYYLATKQSIKEIDAIDSSHINSKAFSGILTPVAFGATISGVKTPNHVIDMTSKLDAKTPSQVIGEASNIFEKSEKKEYAPEPNLITEGAYVLGQRVKNETTKFYKANKIAVRTTIAAIATASALLGGALHVNNINTYNNLSSTSSEYQSYISNATRTELESIRNRLQTYQNPDYTSLTAEEVSKLRDDLDDVINLVIADLSKSAFETANPDCKVTSIKAMYDRTTNINTSSVAPPNPEHFCTINYTDKNGEEKNVVITDFRSISVFAKNSINLAYLNEYDLDHAYVDSTNPSEAHLQELLSKYESILKDTEQLAGTKVIYSDGIISSPTLKTTIPEKDNKNDDAR